MLVRCTTFLSTGFLLSVLAAPVLRADESKEEAKNEKAEAPKAEKKTEEAKVAEPAASEAAKPAKAEEKAEEAKPTEATVVQLRLKGAYEENVPEETPFGPGRLHFRGLLDLIRKATNDSTVAAMHLKCDSPAMGFAQLRELVAALKDFRSAGKKIFAFAENASTLDLMILSSANRIIMPESAMVLLPGVSAEVLYLKGLFDRIGVRFLVTHIGEYKSAFENYSRSEMSPAFREVLEGLIDSYYLAILEIISEGRSIPREKVAEAIDRAFLSATDLRELGLIDEVAHLDHYWSDVKADLGVEKLKVLTNYGRKSFSIETQNPFALFSMIMEAFSPPKRRSSSSSKIAVVYASGMIMPGRSQSSPFGGGGTLGSETLVDALKNAAGDASVKAIVLRIDSPGGSGTASDAIWRAVLEAKEKKPVVASMSDVAGSGGYYIAMGANRILAQPETITGSIGVVSAMLNLKGTMDLLGIHVERISRGKNAPNLSPFTDPAQVSMESLTKLMENFYWQFVEKAALGRGKSREDIHAVAQGRVWTGRDALERGLVDELGGLRRAIEVARELAKVPQEERLDLLELPPAPNFFEAISEAFGMTRLARLGGLLGWKETELGLLGATPEVREALERAALLLQLGRHGTMLLTPVEIRVR